MVEQTGIYYARKSLFLATMTAEESVKYQVVEIERYSTQNNIKLVNKFSDVGFSGSNTNRPELQEMLRYLRTSTQRINVLLFYSIDRLGRDLVDNITLMKEILNYVDKVVFVREGTTSDSAGFKILFTLLTAQAQDFRIQLTRTFASGRRSKVFAFKNYHGRWTPLGYTKLRKKLVSASQLTTENRAEIQGVKVLKHIFYQSLMGDNLSQIAKSLNENYGLTKRGKAWGLSSVRWILKNPVYLGALRGTLGESESYYIEEANVEKLVDPLIFALIQHRLKIEGKGRPRKSVLTRNPHFTLCLDCGMMLTQKKNKLTCLNCKRSVDVIDLYEVLINESLKVIEGNYESYFDKNDFIDTLRLQHKSCLLLYKQTHAQIEQLDFIKGISRNEKSEMLHKLNIKLDNASRELVVVRELIDFISDKSVSDLMSTHKVGYDLLLKLPYLFIVDLSIKNGTNQIYIIFHQEVFINENELLG
ncbi:MAG: recombinase family protein [Desulfosporosinus sp.]|nr:recombinase family protein [Desulfosporosinus sp.]